MVPAWIQTELAAINLGDQRLNRRAQIIVHQLARMAQSTPDACQGKAELVATYRFVENKNVTHSQILKTHQQATLERCANHDTVLLIQDTTEVDLTKPKRQVQGAGYLENTSNFGFYFHPLYAMTEAGLPLGIANHKIWTRDELQTDLNAAQKAQRRKQTPFEDKESYRWYEQFEFAEQCAQSHPSTQWISIADSEADIYELFEAQPDASSNSDFIVRGCQNRGLVKVEGGPTTIDEALNQASFCYTTEVSVSGRDAKISCETRGRRQSREGRQATISVRAVQVHLRAPARPDGKGEDVYCNVVEAVEIDPPAGEEPIRWTLLTSLPIGSRASLERVIRLYGRRWQIELLFRTLKSGLGVEKLKYETLDRYANAFALMLIVAWRVEYLKGAARLDPESSCESYFSASEWQPTYLVVHAGAALPSVAPSMANFILMVAKLGGYIAQKGQGPPGSTTLWRGLRKLEAYSEAFDAFEKSNQTRCVV